ncbi:MAG: polysaccharide deacetylase family protein [Eubacteriales bacterium]|nr:polysaccharide deacetylase family protein [Eubacteriales bacterium]MDD4512379.1 polysaccharide deacetylase family protein [Eubacteriales bacterium]
MALRLFNRIQAKSLLLASALTVISCLYALSGDGGALYAAAVKRELPVYSVNRSDNVISISFDASWGSEQTMQILDTLDEYGVKTTFFLVGLWLEKYPELVKEIAARGHEIGNHSATHAHFPQIGEQKKKVELGIMSDMTETLTGIRPTLFRAPYGDYDDKTVLVSRAEGYEIVQWSIDSLDWKGLSASDIVARCTKSFGSGDIVLFHNDAKHTAEALPQILEKYQAAGLKIIPVSEILLTGETRIDHAGKQHAAS